MDIVGINSIDVKTLHGKMMRYLLKFYIDRYILFVCSKCHLSR